MWTPEKASSITAELNNATPAFATHGERKGLHVKYAFQYALSGTIERHISISSRQTQDGVTLYVNKLSVGKVPYPDMSAIGIKVLQFYPMGYEGKDGEKGLSTAVGSLPTLLPAKNDVYRLSVPNEPVFRQLLAWDANVK